MLSILDLDDNSLMSIFDFLSIYDLLACEKVCQRFESTCELVYGSKRFQRMRIELWPLRTEYLKDIFDRVGKTLRSFEFSGGYIMDENVKQTMINGVSRSCPKLRSLSINYVQFSNYNFAHLLESFCNLTTLDLSRCSINEATLGITLDGERFKSVKTLKLAGNSCMSGSFFKTMRHVEVLDISYCFGLSFYEFLAFLRTCIKLIDLNLSASCQLVCEDESFQQILVTHQPNIERLIMDNTGVARDNEAMSKFKNLKHSSFKGRKFGT